MKISQKIEVGQIGHTYVSSWKSDNEVELHAGDDVVTFSMTEEVMTQLATERLEAAKELAQEESSNDE